MTFLHHFRDVGSLAIFALVSTVACGGSSSTDAGPSIVGVYQLTSLNSGGLPVIISVSGGETAYLNSEVLTANPGGTYQTNGTEVQQNSSGYGSSFAVSSAGTYSASGGAYKFTDNTLGSGTGTLTPSVALGTILTVSLGGATYVFSR